MDSNSSKSINSLLQNYVKIHRKKHIKYKTRHIKKHIKIIKIKKKRIIPLPLKTLPKKDISTNDLSSNNLLNNDNDLAEELTNIVNKKTKILIWHFNNIYNEAKSKLIDIIRIQLEKVKENEIRLFKQAEMTRKYIRLIYSNHHTKLYKKWNIEQIQDLYIDVAMSLTKYSQHLYGKQFHLDVEDELDIITVELCWDKECLCICGCNGNDLPVQKKCQLTKKPPPPLPPLPPPTTDNPD